MATALKDKLVTLEDLKSLYDAVDSRLGGVEENMAVTTANATMKSVSRVTWASDNNLKLIKTGNIVQAIFYIRGSITAGDNISATIATVPSGYRPVADIEVFRSDGNWVYTIATDGSVNTTLQGHSTTTVSIGKYGEIMYIAAS